MWDVPLAPPPQRTAHEQSPKFRGLLIGRGNFNEDEFYQRKDNTYVDISKLLLQYCIQSIIWVMYLYLYCILVHQT